MEELRWIEIYVVVRATEIKVMSHKRSRSSRENGDEGPMEISRINPIKAAL